MAAEEEGIKERKSNPFSSKALFLDMEMLGQREGQCWAPEARFHLIYSVFFHTCPLVDTHGTHTTPSHVDGSGPP